MMKVGPTSMLALAALLAGCVSAKRLDAEIMQPLRPGMNITDAVAVMRKAHFTCSGTDDSGFACVRARPVALIATCIQRLYLYPAEREGGPATVERDPNSCLSW